MNNLGIILMLSVWKVVLMWMFGLCYVDLKNYFNVIFVVVLKIGLLVVM